MRTVLLTFLFTAVCFAGQVQPLTDVTQPAAPQPNPTQAPLPPAADPVPPAADPVPPAPTAAPAPIPPIPTVDPSVLPQQPAVAAPVESTIVVNPPPSAQIIVSSPSAGLGVDTFVLDKKILDNPYQQANFTYLYRTAVLRRAMSALGITYVAAEVKPAAPLLQDPTYETLILNAFRLLDTVWDETYRKAEDKIDGHYAIASRIHLSGGRTFRCTTIVSRREVDPALVWIRNTPCEPEWRTPENMQIAVGLQFTGFLNLETTKFERTPDVGADADSFKSRRQK